jgi:hypothetical protein
VTSTVVAVEKKQSVACSFSLKCSEHLLILSGLKASGRAPLLACYSIRHKVVCYNCLIDHPWPLDLHLTVAASGNLTVLQFL